MMMVAVPVVVTAATVLLLSTVQAFQPLVTNPRHDVACSPQLRMASPNDNDCEHSPTNSDARRSFVLSSIPLLAIASLPQSANAGIDVSGLRVEGQSGSTANPTIASQLKSYYGSAATRVQEIKAVQNVPPPTAAPAADSKAATYALRYTEPRIGKVGLAGFQSQYEGRVRAPEGSKYPSLYVSFQFPSDWLQLDRALGGVQYVDQRNGDKLYLLRAALPEDATLETVPKQWFGNVIFDPQGSILRGGTEVDEYRVSRSQITSTLPPRRRLTLKYYTVTGNGLRVERRGLVDAVQVDGDVYMLVTSSNAVKFEAKGKERETVEAIVDSFRVER